MYQMLSSNLRGGMSFTSQRYCESAVFEDMTGVQRTLDEFERFNLLFYIDANALYSSCQLFNLPYKNFEFMEVEEIQKIEWEKIDLQKETGYFVEVTLSYPESLQEKTSSYPLCPQNIEITHDMLSPYQKKVLLELYGKKTYKAKKLTSTFHKKEKIVLHGLNLQQYLRLGMKLESVHRVIKFMQKPYMTPWINFCTDQRIKAKNAFEKNFWKLIANCVFGKTIEGLENRKKVQICCTSESFISAIKKPCYERHIIVNPTLSIVLFTKMQSKVIRPYYIGFSILEISKFVMYEFYYSILQNYFGQEGVKCLYQDTDSFVLSLKTTDIYSDFRNLGEYFDFSNVHQSHPLFSEKFKSQLFKFKEEMGLTPISRFCALKAKVYSFEVACPHKVGINSKGVCMECENKTNLVSNVNKLKGVQQSTARQLHFEKYLKCIESSYKRRDNVRQITSKNQKITTNFVNKISLSSFDDKRYILNCGIHSEPYSSKNQPYCVECDF